MSTVQEALRAVHERIVEACKNAARDPASVKLVAVSKKHGADAIREAYAAGQRAFGENYVQELVDKAKQLADLSDIEWHVIGHLQRNKAKEVVRISAVVETVDSERLAIALHERAVLEKKIIDVFVQVNVANEAQKSGCASSELEAVASTIRASSALRLRGLMTVPPAAEDARRHFVALRDLAEKIGVSELSMGMSHDLEVAIAEGATSVRVGTAIFGERA